MGTQRSPDRVLVLGYGEMGHALEQLLRPRHPVTVWQRRPLPGPPVDLAAAVTSADIVLFCLPASAHPDLASRIAPYLNTSTIAVTIAKGLDDSGQLPAEALGQHIDRDAIAVIYGPMIAEEIRAGRTAFAELGATRPAVAERVSELFGGSALHLAPWRDVIGLSWAAILKNIYAIAFGLADELQLGDNVRGFLMVRSLHELTMIVQAMGGEPATPFQLAGLGDLVTTATSAGSTHHAIGQRLARGDPQLVGEGIHTLAVLRSSARFEASRFPLFALIDQCAQNPQDAARQFREYIEQV